MKRTWNHSPLFGSHKIWAERYCQRTQASQHVLIQKYQWSHIPLGATSFPSDHVAEANVKCLRGMIAHHGKLVAQGYDVIVGIVSPPLPRLCWVKGLMMSDPGLPESDGDTSLNMNR